MRLAQQICGDLAEGGVLKVLRLGNRWDLAFHQALKRDAKGDVVEFDIDPRLIEQFSIVILLVSSLTAPFVGSVIYSFAEMVYSRIEVGF